MQRRRFLLHGTACLLVGDATWAEGDSGIVVVGHASLPRIDTGLVQRLFTGRAIEAGGQLTTPINLRAGHPLRQRFLAAYLQTDEERYRAYWTVRRHVGKGHHRERSTAWRSCSNWWPARRGRSVMSRWRTCGPA